MLKATRKKFCQSWKPEKGSFGRKRKTFNKNWEKWNLKCFLRLKKKKWKKQFDASFLEVAKYSQWVANIVPVPKKDGKVWIYVDYQDLNRASPKDNFPLPHINILVDTTTKNSLFSFMDRFLGYNQIRIAPEDMEKTIFMTMWGTFYYKVMPLG